VDNAASGANNGTDWNNAWESLSAINWSKISSGDTIYISGGRSSKTYKETLDVSKSGSSSNRLTITKGVDAGHNGEVILDGQLIGSPMIDLSSRDYVTVSHLTVTNQGKYGIYLRYCNNTIVDNCTVKHVQRCGVRVANSTNCVVSNNKLSTDSYVARQTDGIYTQHNKNITFDGNHIVINNNHADGHDDCIQSYMDDGVIAKNNYCEQNNNKTSNAQGIYLTTSYGTLVVYNNVVYAPNTYNSLVGIRLPNSGVNGIIVNNTLIGSKWGAIWVEKNTPVVIKNNIAWRYNGGAPLSYSGDKDQISNNLFYSDPKLDTNFRPLDNSPAIDAGAYLSTPYQVDKDGVTRPQGNGFDIGAYEKTDSSSQITVEPPTNLRIVMN
jgi:parallel beta-helix repeat protein